MARYFRRTDGQSLWAFVPSIANLAAPSTAEVNAGSNITIRIAGVTGFEYKNNPIKTPDMSSSFVSSIIGEDEATDSALMFYDDTTSTALWTLMAKGAVGFILVNEYAKTVSSKTRVWPVTSTGPVPQYDMGAEAAQFTVGYAVTARPNLDAVFPTGVTI